MFYVHIVKEKKCSIYFVFDAQLKPQNNLTNQAQFYLKIVYFNQTKQFLSRSISIYPMYTFPLGKSLCTCSKFILEGSIIKSFMGFFNCRVSSHSRMLPLTWNKGSRLAISSWFIYRCITNYHSMFKGSYFFFYKTWRYVVKPISFAL